MSFSLESALIKAQALQDEKLIAALQLAQGDQRWEALLQPLHGRNRADVSSDEGGQRHAMCPDLYRAALKGSIDLVKDLLGFTEHMTHTDGTDHVDESYVDILLGNSPETKRSNKHWGGRFGVDHCTLQEVTAEKNTVLHIAAEQGHVKLVELIIRRDSTLLLYKNSRHETPLHLAARAGNCSIISLIIFLAQESGIGASEVLTKRSINGETVLHEAVRHGHEDVIKVLMIAAPALSADMNNGSMSPLYLAVVRKSVGVVKELSQHPHTSAAGPNQQNALHAATIGSHEIASMLLDWKAELAIERDASGSTPVHYAASSGNIPVLEKILKKMPWAVYIQDQEGSSPLHVAARMHNYDSIHCMIDHCPDSFELRDNHGRNFLHIGAQHDGKIIDNHNHCEFNKIEHVLHSHDLKKLVNERDNEGNTPLHFASLNGFSETILQLLEKTADAKVMNNDGKTALDYAVSSNMGFFNMASTITTLFTYGAIFSPQRQDKLQNWTDKTTAWTDKVSKNLIVVAVLIATVAFSATFNVPGAYNDEGVANMRRNFAYQFILVLDAIAMSTSVSAAILLVVSKAASKRSSWISFSFSLYLLWTSLVVMEMAFVLALTETLGNGRLVTKMLIMSFSILIFIWTARIIYKHSSPAKFGTVRRFLSPMKEQRPIARQIDIQFPMLASYVRRSYLFILLNLFLYFLIFGTIWIYDIVDMVKSK